MSCNGICILHGGFHAQIIVFDVINFRSNVSTPRYHLIIIENEISIEICAT